MSTSYNYLNICYITKLHVSDFEISCYKQRYSHYKQTKFTLFLWPNGGTIEELTGLYNTHSANIKKSNYILNILE